ncbi:glycosyltransferase family 2 protein [Polaribacter sp. IC073]|uniref:glycosyltransferase family 2 protein n=1 Tax=Polaribacter sp. IC073 TaxID=2508540 RepID=UPI0011BF63D4|nr:glycosyltransferase family 2 protein [Polaribacter sp. IC073]TXD49117.1 glycosyltransferase family 2 protein [Polaribacter sp. IC073]
MHSEPRITIVLTTFNRAHFIRETLDSVLAQNYKNWECIIIDDNSIDDTSVIVEKYIETDKRLEYIVKEKCINKGLPASRNIGIKKAKGEYLVFFDDDDIVHPQLIECCVESFKKKNISFVHYNKQSFEGDFDNYLLQPIIVSETKLLGENIYEKVILGTLPLASCTVMWKTALFKKNLFNEALMYAEEWECYSRLLILNNLKGILINNFLYFNRKHIQSNTGEFWSNDKNRKESYIQAHKLVLELLIEKNKINRSLKKYFFQKSYVLKEKHIIDPLLDKNLINRISFFFYPIKYYLYKIVKEF